ncbi:expressed unknown protein [Seminavis robusta]|uniref:Uncharacterized protein n=1 Tax=Seminavis robusta TaxID=568900 RepID=A0A9N8DU52_9STRA|nr:expressed unknown protein [Seminavis robusta]|eukprot:Sro281_g107180.1 n/a (316) ;mRNA; f:13417-14364
MPWTMEEAQSLLPNEVPPNEENHSSRTMLDSLMHDDDDDLHMDILSLTKSDETTSTENDEEDNIILMATDGVSGGGVNQSDDFCYESFGFLERNERACSPLEGRISTSIFNTTASSGWVGDTISKSLLKMQNGLKCWHDSWERLAEEQVMMPTTTTLTSRSSLFERQDILMCSSSSSSQSSSPPPQSRQTWRNMMMKRKSSFFPMTKPKTPTSTEAATFPLSTKSCSAVGYKMAKKYHHVKEIRTNGIHVVELVPLRTGSQEEESMAFECSWVDSDYDYRPRSRSASENDLLLDNSSTSTFASSAMPPALPLRRV